MTVKINNINNNNFSHISAASYIEHGPNISYLMSQNATFAATGGNDAHNL